MSIGIPIALVTYWAFVATIAGTFAGAWLGFHVTSGGFGLAAPLFAIIGATAGANLVVLALDIQRDRAARAVAATSRRLAVGEASA